MDRHRKSNMALMAQNLDLIKQIKHQRENNKGEKHTLQVGVTRIGMYLSFVAGVVERRFLLPSFPLPSRSSHPLTPPLPLPIL